VGAEQERAAAAEKLLQQLTPDQLNQLERITANGTVPLSQLPHELALPIGQYLVAQSCLTLGRACDRFFDQRQQHPLAAFQYGVNQLGTRQFSFDRGNSFLGVAPD